MLILFSRGAAMSRWLFLVIVGLSNAVLYPSDNRTWLRQSDGMYKSSTSSFLVRNSSMPLLNHANDRNIEFVVYPCPAWPPIKEEYLEKVLPHMVKKKFLSSEEREGIEVNSWIHGQLIDMTMRIYIDRNFQQGENACGDDGVMKSLADKLKSHLAFVQFLLQMNGHDLISQSPSLYMKFSSEDNCLMQKALSWEGQALKYNYPAKNLFERIKTMAKESTNE